MGHEDQPIPEPNPDNIPLFARGDLLHQAERDVELAQHLDTLRLATLAAQENPADRNAQWAQKNAEELVRNYLDSGSARPQNPQG